MSEEEGDEEAVTSAAPPPCWWRGRPVDAFHTALRRAVADRGLVLSHTLHASATSVVFLVAWPGGQAASVGKLYRTRPSAALAAWRIVDERHVLPRYEGEVPCGAGVGHLVLMEWVGRPVEGLAAAAAADVGGQVLAALAQLHAMRVGHGDVALENVVVDDVTGRAWLVDLDALCRVPEQQEEGDSLGAWFDVVVDHDLQGAATLPGGRHPARLEAMDLPAEDAADMKEPDMASAAGLGGGDGAAAADGGS